MDKESRHGQTVRYTKVNGKTGNNMEKENLHPLKEK
jgi:hypothetical protein